MTFTKIVGSLLLLLTLSAHSFWIDFNDENQIHELVNAQNDRGDNTDYTEFHGLGYVVAVDDGIILPLNNDWNPESDNFTVAYRFKSNNAITDWKWHVEKSSRTDKWGRGWAFYQEDGEVKFRGRGDNGDSAVIIAVPVTTSAKWHHVVGTINRNNQEIRLYVDGRMAKPSIANLGNAITAQSGKMGVARYHESANNHLSWKIEDIQVFDRALGSKSVRALTGDMNNQNWTH